MLKMKALVTKDCLKIPKKKKTKKEEDFLFLLPLAGGQ